MMLLLIVVVVVVVVVVVGVVVVAKIRNIARISSLGLKPKVYPPLYLFPLCSPDSFLGVPFPKSLSS